MEKLEKLEKLGTMEAALRKLASKPSAVATFTLLTALLPWIITFTPPLLRSLQVGFATDAWRFMVGWLTTPVLFLLVNFVILSIWATSSAGAAASSHRDAAAEAPSGAHQQDPVVAKRSKETLIFLPQVTSPPKPSAALHGSVFSRSSPQESITFSSKSALLDSDEDDQDEETSEDQVTSREASLLNPKILPPPRPSFLQSAAAAAAARKPKQQMDRRNSVPVNRSSKQQQRTLRPTLSEQKRSVTPLSIETPSSNPGVVFKEVSFGDSNVNSSSRKKVVESEDEFNKRIEFAIANFKAQLRLQGKENEDDF